VSRWAAAAAGGAALRAARLPAAQHPGRGPFPPPAAAGKGAHLTFRRRRAYRPRKRIWRVLRAGGGSCVGPPESTRTTPRSERRRSRWNGLTPSLFELTPGRFRRRFGRRKRTCLSTETAYKATDRPVEATPKSGSPPLLAGSWGRTGGGGGIRTSPALRAVLSEWPAAPRDASGCCRMAAGCHSRSVSVSCGIPVVVTTGTPLRLPGGCEVARLKAKRPQATAGA